MKGTQVHAASADEQVSLRAAAASVPGPDYDAAAAPASLRAISASVLIVVGELDSMTGVSVARTGSSRCSTTRALRRSRSCLTSHGVDQPDAFREAVVHSSWDIWTAGYLPRLRGDSVQVTQQPRTDPAAKPSTTTTPALTATPSAMGVRGVGGGPCWTTRPSQRPRSRSPFSTSIDEGRRRLSRGHPASLATGVVGGIDVGTGVLGLLLRRVRDRQQLLGGLAFGIGFIALTLARSELFTEDFLVPVTTVIARQARLRMLIRLWAGTLVTNLVGGWVFTWLIIRASRS